MINSNLLRRLSRPLRAGSPRLYAFLNALRRRLLAGGRPLAGYQANALRRFGRLQPLRGRRVLEIGSDVGGVVLRELARRGAEAVGVNPAPEIWTPPATSPLRLAPGAELYDADAADLPFPAGSFDAVFSVATFEHLLDLPRVLSEMHRVLRPGGIVYSHFGPIWSGCRGHHLRVQVGDLEARHFKPETNPLPDFAHLLLGPAELREGLKGRCPEPLREPIVQWVYQDTGINRLFYWQYLEMFQTSALRVVALREETDAVPAHLRSLLELRHPRESRFDVTNAEVVFRKDG